jgi:DNA-binding response OmpR family regulator
MSIADQIGMRKLPQIPPSQPGIKDRVLVVDSERLMARVTRRILEDQGYVIDEALSTAEAFEAMVRCHYRSILIDDSIDEIEMKGFLGAIRKLVGYQEPIVILSDRTFHIDPKITPVVFLQKPFTYDELVNLLELIEKI